MSQLQRLPRNSRPCDPIPPLGLPPLVLLAACRADPRWHERAEAVEEALAWEPPISVPVPLAEIPAAEAASRVGAYSRWLEAKRRAGRQSAERQVAATQSEVAEGLAGAPPGTQHTGTLPENAAAEGPAEPAGEQSGAGTCSDAPGRSGTGRRKALSGARSAACKPPRRQPQKSRYGKRKLVPGRAAA